MVKNFIPISLMHFQTSTGNLFAQRFTSFHSSHSIFHFSSTGAIYRFINNFCFVCPRLCYFPRSSDSESSFSISLTLPENLPSTLPFLSFKTLTRGSSFPALSLCLANLHNSFSPYFIYPGLGPVSRNTGIYPDGRVQLYLQIKN